MPDQANVNDSQAFAMLRQALHKFRQAADQALTAGDAEVARVQFWLETEQAAHWQVQLRKRREAMVKAREAVRQKKLYKDSAGRVPSAVEEEKVLAKCARALQEAEEKATAVKKALPRLLKGNDLYRGGVARLKNSVAAEIPNAIALLDRLAENIEQYVQLEAPGTMQAEAPPPAQYEGTMVRPEDAPAPPPAVSEPPQPPATRAPAEPEGSHVHG